MRALRPGGVLIATVPFGRAQTLDGFRVYDRARIAAAFPGSSLTVFMKDGALGGIAPVTAVACLTCLR